MKIKTLLNLAAALCLGACAQQQEQPAFPEDAEVFETPSGTPVRLACIFHGSIALEYGGTVIQVDPVTEMRGTTIDYSAFGPADAIFICHEHPDHYCPAAVEQLSDENTHLFVNSSVKELAGDKATLLLNGDKGQLTDHISYEAIPAYNTTEGHEMFHPKGCGNGYIFDFDGFRIYVSGDTEPIEDMKALGKIDVALLATNQPFTMTVDQCIEAAKTINPGILIPYHLGDTDMEAIAAGLDGSGIEVRLRPALR